MPKMKTNRAAKKRFKLTASGKIKRGHSFARHILTSKDSKRKRGLRQMALVAEVDVPRVKQMILA